MTALSRSYRIPDYNIMPHTGLNIQFWMIDNTVMTINNQSTVFRETGDLSITNRLEIRKIISFSDLEDGWDSYDAKEISLAVISKAIDLVKDIDLFNEDVYFTSPGPNGEIMIQLKNETKEVELIVYDHSIKYVIFVSDEYEDQGSFTYDKLPEIIEWLTI